MAEKQNLNDGFPWPQPLKMSFLVLQSEHFFFVFRLDHGLLLVVASLRFHVHRNQFLPQRGIIGYYSIMVL